MSKKMGRPRLPKSKAKGVQVGLRFSPTEHKEVEGAAREDNAQKVEWLRRVALEAARQPWVTAGSWKADDLHDKLVDFKFIAEDMGPVSGEGRFNAWAREDGKMRLRIVSRKRGEHRPDKATEFYVQQWLADLIKANPAGSKCAFSIVDSRFQRYAPAPSNFPKP